MLLRISDADYGMHADEHLAALRQIRDENCVPSPLRWIPKEVLELVRWSEPSAGGKLENGVGFRDHFMRAFCCAALLLAGADSKNRGMLWGENQTLIQLLDSVLAIKCDFPSAAGAFMTWRLTGLRDGDELRPFFAFGLAALTVMQFADRLSSDDVITLIDFVNSAELAVRDPAGVCTLAILGGSFLDVTTHDQRHRAWKTLAATVRARISQNRDLQDFCERIEKS